MAGTSIWDFDPNFSGITPAGGTPTYQAPAMPAPQNNFSFYQPGQYGATQDWFNTPISQQMREENQNLAYGYYGNQQGIQNNDSAFNQWFYKQFPKFQQSYGMASMENPMLTMDQFLKTLPTFNQLQSQYQMQSPSARGEQVNAFASTPRWMNR